LGQRIRQVTAGKKGIFQRNANLQYNIPVLSDMIRADAGDFNAERTMDVWFCQFTHTGVGTVGFTAFP
jgi:hypothetical protein